jgi:2'-5' RNA ligase/uncharacterized protein (UPF0248 family)
MPAPKRQPFPTSREVYDRVRWDARFDPRRFAVVHEDRVRGDVEVPFLDFTPGGDVPWHRVQAFLCDGEVVWDRRARVDRLFVRDPRGALPPSAAAPRSTDRIAGDPPRSDYRALAVVLGREAAVVPDAGVHTSALMIAPPEDRWGPIQAIRLRHDRHASRWMPHVNLLYGFVPERCRAEAEPALAAALEGVAPFTVTLAGFDSFGHAGSATVWLRPESDPPGALEALEARLRAVFPGCVEQATRGEQGYRPHLAVAQTAKGAAREAVGVWSATWQPLRFTVDAAQWITRRGDEPFRLLCRVPLGAGLAAALAARGESASPDTVGSQVAALDPLRSG